MLPDVRPARGSSLWIALFMLVLAASFAAACGDDDAANGSGPVDPPPAPKASIAAVDCEAGFVVAPGAPITLRAIARGADGAPLSGADVVFVAPESGPSGTFQAADPAGPSYARVKTGPDGIATATLTANGESGVYLVEAQVAGYETLGATFAVTQGVAAPPVSLKDARCKIDALPEANPQTSSVHGPFVLAAGARIVAAGPTQEPPAPVDVMAPSLFFWIDERPKSKFEHPTRFVLLDASDPAAAPSLTSARYWPTVSIAEGAPPVDLISALSTNPTKLPEHTPILPASRAVGVDIEMRTRPLDLKPGPGACAIVITGEPDEYLKEDARRMSKMFREHLGVRTYEKTSPSGQPVGSTIDDIKSFIERAKKDGCTKVYFYVSAHGGTTALDKMPQPDGTRGLITYASIAEIMIENFGGDIPVCIVIDACYSGGAIEAFQGVGLRGTIMTAADIANESRASKGLFGIGMGSYFSEEYRLAWRRAASNDTNGDNVLSDEEIFDFIKRHGTGNVVEPNPQLTKLLPEPVTTPGPELTITCPGAESTLVVPPPPSPAIPPNGLVAKLQIGAPFVAIARNVTVISPGQGARITARGVAPGTSTYSVTAYADQVAFRVSGPVTVGPDCPDPGAPGGSGVATTKPQFEVNPINGVFTQATFSTAYSLTVTNPLSEAISIAWSGPDCATFTPDTPTAPSTEQNITSTMVWEHPHPPCDPSTDHATTTIRATIVGLSGAVRCTYEGSASRTGPACHDL